jgi:CheY-like chemotaxis protein
VSPLTRAKTVLLVEDNVSVRYLYRRALADAHYTVLESQDGLDALQRMEKHPVDVIVLDLRLPGMSGWDVYHALRSRWTTKKVPIIVATGHDLGDIDTNDVAAFLEKPIGATEIVEAVDKVLKGSPP